MEFQKDPELYYRLMAEIGLYLRQYQPKRSWLAVVLFPTEGVDPGLPEEYQALDDLLIKRIYLVELRDREDLSLEMGVVRLVVEKSTRTEAWARRLLEQVRGQEPDQRMRERLLEVIETVLAYRYPERLREEIMAMFGLSELKQTRYYQGAKQEGRTEERIQIALNLLEAGVEVEVISQATGLTQEELQSLCSGSSS